MTLATELRTAPIELPIVAQLRARTEPITLGLNVLGRFERYGLNGQLRAQRSEVREAMFDVAMASVDHDQLGWLDTEMQRQYAADARAYLDLFQSAAIGVFSKHGIHAPVNVVDISGITGGVYQYENAFIRTLAEQALERTPLPITGATTDYTEGSPAATIALDGLDYLSRANRAWNTRTTGQEATMPDNAANGSVPTGMTLELTADELQQLALLLGLISDKERQLVSHADAAITRISAAAEADRG